MQKERVARFMNVRHTQPSSSDTLAWNRQRRFYTNYFRFYANYFLSPSAHDSERPGIEAMEHWEADAAVFRYSHRHESGERATKYLFLRRGGYLPGNTYKVLFDALNYPELLRLQFRQKLESIDFRDADHHRRLQASSLGKFDIDIFCKVEVITKGGMHPSVASFILHNVIETVRMCAKEHLSKQDKSSEEKLRVDVFRAEKSMVSTLDECNDEAARIYFPIRGTKGSTGLKDLMEKLATVKNVQEVRCFVQSEPQSEPQGIVVWMGRSSTGKSK
ncbi:hypothetical protein KC343_g10073 [Hortaea werneckii]|nr:hypothetical protein KC338_g7620 [Hortaea werneckii]KAI6861391.1 hypothetical protein KC323_g5879 [Hortaea werneckii]KAI7121404.1 hypothetical protein KC352_g32918 [Hortaea werneckii]KAI7351129.1 hypothetical protein KC320_g5145 [Hortaea werneckii]KAI7565187.1 hypothetical protein KC317_g6537 [Hortaea werneckii]